MTDAMIEAVEAKVSHMDTASDELVNFVSQDLDTTKADAHLIVESVTRGIAELSRRHDLVRVPNLGSFRVLETDGRDGRNRVRGRRESRSLLQFESPFLARKAHS